MACQLLHITAILYVSALLGLTPLFMIILSDVLKNELKLIAVSIGSTFEGVFITLRAKEGKHDLRTLAQSIGGNASRLEDSPSFEVQRIRIEGQGVESTSVDTFESKQYDISLSGGDEGNNDQRQHGKIANRMDLKNKAEIQDYAIPGMLPTSLHDN